MQVTITAPGSVYRECFDPAATDYPRESGLPQPTIAKVGRGRRYSYLVDVEMAKDMLTHAFDFGVGLSHGVDDVSIGRKVARWAADEARRLGIEEGVLV